MVKIAFKGGGSIQFDLITVQDIMMSKTLL